MKRRVFNVPIILEVNNDGFLASCTLIQGAFAEGDTPEEALFNLFDVIHLIISYRRERGEEIPNELVNLACKVKSFSFTIPISI